MSLHSSKHDWLQSVLHALYQQEKTLNKNTDQTVILFSLLLYRRHMIIGSVTLTSMSFRLNWSLQLPYHSQKEYRTHRVWWKRCGYMTHLQMLEKMLPKNWFTICPDLYSYRPHWNKFCPLQKPVLEAGDSPATCPIPEKVFEWWTRRFRWYLTFGDLLCVWRSTAHLESPITTLHFVLKAHQKKDNKRQQKYILQKSK